MVFWIIVFRSLREFVWLVWCWIWIRLDQIWRIWVLYYEHGFLPVIGIPQTRLCDVVVSMNIWVRMPCVRLGERSKEHIDECFFLLKTHVTCKVGSNAFQNRSSVCAHQSCRVCPSVIRRLLTRTGGFCSSVTNSLPRSGQEFAKQ